MLARLRGDLLAVRRPLSAGIGLILLAAAFEVVLPWPVKWIVDSVFGTQPFPAWMRALPLVTRTKTSAAIAIAVAALVLSALHKLTQSASQYWVTRSGYQMVARLRARTLEHLYALSLRFHDQSKVGDLLYRAAYDCYAVVNLLSGSFVPLGTGLVVAVGVVVVMSRIDIRLTLITVATAPVLALVIRLFRARIERAARVYHERESGFAAAVQESLGFIRVVQAFGLEAATNQRLAGASNAGLAAGNTKTWWELAFSCSVGLIMAAGTSAVLWAGAEGVLAGRLWPGDVLLFLAYMGMLYQPLSAFGQSASVYHSAAAQLGRVFEILDRTPDLVVRPGARKPARVDGRIDLVDVDFSYEADRQILRSVNLSIAPGEVIGVVGPTGSGKSTLASLLMRFYDPDAGRIALDGCDLRDLDLRWLRSQVALVLQDPFLFSGTIRENIRNGNPAASDAQVRRAAELAQAEDFIDALPDGFDTVLGERGVNLSGGQRQRLAIARAFLKNAPILVLDEPTSALDVNTEQALTSALGTLMRGRTTIIIAHRLSTIRMADRIVVLAEGGVVEQGTHDQLMAADTVYRRLCRTQPGGADALAIADLAHALHPSVSAT